MMHWKTVRTRVGLMAMLGVVTACSTPALVELRQVEPVADPFYTALTDRYLEFSEEEAAQYDWGDSRYFAEKGLRAAYGHDLQPEEPEKWHLSDEERMELASVRPRLMKALSHQAAKTTYPAMAAEALFHYDCWIEQQEEAWQKDDIAYCRDTFYAALEGLEHMLRQKSPRTPAALSKKTMPAKLPPKTKAAPVVKVKQQKADEPVVLATSYIIFFDLGKTYLDSDGRKVVNRVLEEVKKFADYSISINGHADSVGKASVNKFLSLKRANIVKQALVKGGISAKRITVSSFGESVLRVNTVDEVGEKANRRVEIFINQ